MVSTSSLLVLTLMPRVWTRVTRVSMGVTWAVIILATNIAVASQSGDKEITRKQGESVSFSCDVKAKGKEPLL